MATLNDGAEREDERRSALAKDISVSSQPEWPTMARAGALGIYLAAAVGAIALAGCATTSTTVPQDEAGAGQMTLVCAPPVEVGEVSAVLVSLKAPDGVHLAVPTLQAVSKGTQVDPLDLDTAIEKAGDTAKLVPALDHVNSRGSMVALGVAGTVLVTSLDMLLVPAHVGLIAPWAFADVIIHPGHHSLESAKFELNSARSGGAGYLFFPRGNYQAVQSVAREFDSISGTNGDDKVVKCPLSRPAPCAGQCDAL